MSTKPSNLNLRGAIPQSVEDTTAETSETPEKTENIIPVPMVETPKTDSTAEILKALQHLQTQMSEVQKENAKLKEFSALSVMENQKQSQERYKWPWKYSYKMYEGKPICSLHMTKNQVLLNATTGRYVANQTLELTLADWGKMDVDYAIFYQVYTTSEKMFAKEIIERDWKKLIKFEVNGEQFTVDDSAIN